MPAYRTGVGAAGSVTWVGAPSLDFVNANGVYGYWGVADYFPNVAWTAADERLVAEMFLGVAEAAASGPPEFAGIGTQLQGTGSTAPVDLPDNVAVGNVLRVTLFVDTAGGSVTAMPSGWANAADSPQHASNHHLYVMWKRVAPGDAELSGATADFTLSGSVYRQGACERYINVIESGDPWDMTNGATAEPSVNDTPDVADTTSVANTLLTFSATNWSGGTWTQPSGFTERRDSGDGTSTSSDKLLVAAGSTGTIVATCTGADKRCAWVGALKGTEVGGEVTLTVDDITQLTTTDSPLLTQDHTLVANDTAQATQMDAPTLVQQHNLSAADTTQLTTVDGATLSQVHILAPADTAQTTQADSPALTQVHQLSAADTAQATQVDSPSLTQVHNLVVQDSVQATTIDNVTLESGATLVVNDVALATQMDAPALTQAHALAASDTAQATQADSPTLTQVHNLVVQDAVQATTADTVTLVQQHNIAAHEVVQETQVDSVVLQIIGGAVTLTVNDVIVAVVTDHVRLVSKGFEELVNDKITDAFLRDAGIKARDDAITRAFITGKP